MSNQTSRSYHAQDKPYTPEEMAELFKIKVVLPEANKHSFGDIIGNKQLVDYLKNVVELLNDEEQLQSLEGSFDPTFFLLGPEGSGKELMCEAFAKALGLPLVVIKCENLIEDFSTKVYKGLHTFLEQFEKCVVLYKDVHYGVFKLDEDKAMAFFTKLNKIKDKFPQDYFFASASDSAEYPPFFVSKDGFANQLTYNAPDPEERVELLKIFLKDIPHDESIDLEKLAKDFFGYTGGGIKAILNKARTKCVLEKHQDFVTYDAIHEIIYAEELGEKGKKLSDEEMRMVAYHESGHLIAGYYGHPHYIINKMEIAHRSHSLGITEETADEDSHLSTRADVKGEIISCLGGFAAEYVMLETTTTGVTQDLAQATIHAIGYVKYYGMDSSIGTVCLHEDILDSRMLNDTADVRVQELLNDCQHKAIEIILKHKDKLEALAEALIKKETLYKDEILAILTEKPANEVSAEEKPAESTTPN